MVSTAHSSSTGIHSLPSTWNLKKRRANLPLRIGMFSVEALAVAAAMFLIPTFIQRIVNSFDEAYELLGRRARSPYKSVSWSSVIVAILFMLGWHVWLGRLSYKTVIEEDCTPRYESQGIVRQERISWGRILGRIVLPLFLLAFALQFAYFVLQGYMNPPPLVTANRVDIRDDPSILGR